MQNKNNPFHFRAQLADYFLDFGHVVAGNTCSQSVTITNNGFFPVSMAVDRSIIVGSGFFLGLDRVRQLPPDESLTFNVTFDPKCIEQGVHSAIVPFNVSMSSARNIHLTFTLDFIQKYGLCYELFKIPLIAVSVRYCYCVNPLIVTS